MFNKFVVCKKLSRKGDCIFQFFLKLSIFIILFILVGIIISLVLGSWLSIKKFGLSFIWSNVWDIQSQMFGGLSSIFGTLVTSTIALFIAVPISFGIAIFLTELSPNWLKKPLSIAVELLAAIPSIVYGMWGLFVFVPIFANYFQKPLKNIFSGIPIIGKFFEGPVFGIGILAAGVILSIMIIPYISSVMREVFEQNLTFLKESAYAVGCTTWEVIWHIVIPYTRNGVISGIMLGLGRALGETMAVTFVVGNTYKLDSFSLFMPGNSITSALSNEFAESENKLHASALMELGLILFFITFIVLIISKLMIRSLSSTKRY